MGYSETYKAFKIYVLGERHIEVSRYVTFYEEATFKKSKELECEIEGNESPISEDLDDDSSPSDVQRETLAKHAKPPIIDEPIELVDEHPTKRRSTWCRDILRDVENHGAPIGTSRHRKQPNRY